MKKPLKIVLLVLAALVLLVVGYLAYVLIDYHRLGDMDLEVDRQVLQPAETGREYHLLSYNIGFGAYEPDYGFFMDGGTESWAWSQERLTDNIGNIGSFLSQQHADFYLIQEVDRDSTRSYHVDEAALLREALPEYDGTWAQNYDSPFLMLSPAPPPRGVGVGADDPVGHDGGQRPAGGAAHRKQPDEAGGSGPVLQRAPDPGGRRRRAGAV